MRSVTNNSCAISRLVRPLAASSATRRSLGRSLVVAVSQSDVVTSTLFRLGLGAAPKLVELAVLEGASVDGLAFGRSGRIYAALPERSAVGVLSASGALERTIAVPGADELAGLSFLDEDLLVANHAFGNLEMAPRVVSRIGAGEPGARRFRPAIPERAKRAT